jgi:phosphatidylglycerol lysyltransferase
MEPSTFQAAVELIHRHGWNSTCYQILNPGMERWFSQSGDALVGYVLCKGVRVVAGAPVCSLERLPEVVKEWEDDCLRSGHRVCYFGAEGRMVNLLKDHRGYATVCLGAQPNWDPQGWASTFDGNRTLRAQRNRAKHKGLVISEWTEQEVREHQELHRCLEYWLENRGLPPMHFLVEPEALGFVGHRRVFVAEKYGTPVGFLVLCPVPERKGWLTEQFPRGFDAPNGTVESLMDFAIRAVANSGAEYVTMGIVPLSPHGDQATQGNPKWLQWLTRRVRSHGIRFYNFEGLDRFKSKFKPDDWEPIYVISKESHFSLTTLVAIAAAFTQGPPTLAVVKGLAKAIRQEGRWLIGKISKR